MSGDSTANDRDVRRAYEVGRLRWSLWRASLLTLPIALFAIITEGRTALVAIPITLALWVVSYWRGDVFLRGAFYGLLGGGATSILPMSILRPCCASGAPMSADCCTMPGACLGAGAVVGMILAVAVPFGKVTWWRSALGVAIGMTSIAVLRCASLFAGEALGLVGGIIAGVAAATAARWALRRRWHV